jgi:hypothetical protein
MPIAMRVEQGTFISPGIKAFAFLKRFGPVRNKSQELFSSKTGG